MRLFFDARFTRTDRHDGISRYGSCLLAAVIEQARGTDVSVTAIVCDPRQLSLLPPCEHVVLSGPMSPREPFIARDLNRLGADVVFSTMQTMGSWGRRYRLILTLHDLIYYDHPEPPHDLPAPVRGAWRLYHRAYWPQRLMLDRADAVAAVSATTAGLIAAHRLTKRPVRVVANAAQPLAQPPRRAPGHAARSLVYMGAFLPYKNVEALIRALDHLPGYTLHLASKIAPERERALRALVPDRARVAFHRGVTDDEYHALLDSATALVTASRAEGFGLPVIEAMMRAAPVAISDLPIFHEIADTAAEYFDPESPAAIAAAVRRLEDPEVWAARSAAGPDQARTFSWESSARGLLELAGELAAQGPVRS
ncbi:glycosyltransferase [Brevibacterium sp. 5221]|uniref:Glycosyltransferase n=1 Tax=Brevibacterium rongguiense TaxID=2695267 RepID=A0A6N9H5I0_9MICO|nr:MULTISPECIES: glycosyltransferase family 1 protein [Brevibacterium]MYM19143.1 glycosyltransferase [Brevibacterium rongguiense]WAL40612.1 glycosyltransferase family 1 protein [Brevibacterium sp. BRM-1]